MSLLDVLPSEPSWLKERVILLAKTGSHAYGTSTNESDTDIRGICIPPAYAFIEKYNEINNTGGKTYKNKKDDIDINIVSLIKFANDAIMGTPNAIDLLFMRKEDYHVLTPIGQQLIDIRHQFLSKQVKYKFGGYIRTIIHDLEKNSKGYMSAYGYDTKKFMHAVRLIESAIEILNTGNYSTYRHNYADLLCLRNGKYTLYEAIDMLKSMDLLLNQADIHSPLPDQPDKEYISTKIMMFITESFNF